MGVFIAVFGALNTVGLSYFSRKIGVKSHLGEDCTISTPSEGAGLLFGVHTHISTLMHVDTHFILYGHTWTAHERGCVAFRCWLCASLGAVHLLHGLSLGLLKHITGLAAALWF